MTPRSLQIAFALCFLAIGSVFADVRLTEFEATNTSGITDEDGTFQPWIEVWNTSTTDKLALTGWTLSHGAATWTFPNVEIQPDERIVVWASGKNRIGVTSPLHTNFTLAASGGTLTLRNSSAVIVSQFQNYPAQSANKSWGRDEWDTATVPTSVGSYSTPTPGERNNYSGTGVAGKLTIGTSSRAFTGTLSVPISQVTPDAGAIIRYTTDGSVPTGGSTQYSTALTVSATAVIRARVFKSGLLPGETETQGFLLLDASTSGFSSTMPIVALTNFGAGEPPAEGDQNSFMWVWTQSPTDNRSHLTDLPVLAVRTVIDRHGRTTLGNAKYNVNVEARKPRDDDDNDVALLGMPAGSDYIFSGPYDLDRSEIHNPFIFSLSNQIGRYAPRVQLAELFFEVNGGALKFSGTSNGDYFGIYNIEEKIRRDSDRVDIAKLTTYDNSTPAVTGGYIWKVDQLDTGDTGFSAGGQTMAYYYPKEREIKSPQRDPQEQYLTSAITAFYTALNGANSTNPITGYAAYLDVDAAIDHHLLNTWAFNVDAFRLSGYWHKDRGGKLIAGPAWDFDRALSGNDDRDDNPAVWTSTGSTAFFSFSWWDKLFHDIDFYQKYIDRWQNLRRDIFSRTKVEALIDSLNAQMSQQAIDRDVARWGKTKRAWTRPYTPFNTIAASQTAEVQRLKDYLQQRADFFDSQWLGPVNPSIAAGSVASGTKVTLTGPANATIYYSVNGTDPRPSGGGAPSPAQIYNAGTQIPVNGSTRIRARAYNSNWALPTGSGAPPLVSKWGGLLDANYSTFVPAAAGSLVMTEINYHPANPTAAELAIKPTKIGPYNRNRSVPSSAKMASPTPSLRLIRSISPPAPSSWSRRIQPLSPPDTVPWAPWLGRGRRIFPIAASR